MDAGLTKNEVVCGTFAKNNSFINRSCLKRSNFILQSVKRHHLFINRSCLKRSNFILQSVKRHHLFINRSCLKRSKIKINQVFCKCSTSRLQVFFKCIRAIPTRYIPQTISIFQKVIIQFLAQFLSLFITRIIPHFTILHYLSKSWLNVTH